MIIKYNEEKRDCEVSNIIEVDDATIDKVFDLLNNVVEKFDVVGVSKLLVRKLNFKQIKEILEVIKNKNEKE